MEGLTQLQARCVIILQRRLLDSSAAYTDKIAWELEKTGDQTRDCLNRLVRKGLVAHVGVSKWALTEAGHAYRPALPPGE